MESQQTQSTQTPQPQLQDTTKAPAAGSLAEPVAWQAPEGIQVQRTAIWYSIFGIVTLALMVVSIFLLKSWTFAILIPVMAAALILQSSRPPRIINYAISPKGVYVADKLYDFSEFRAFGLLKDRAQHSAVLLPVKRFSPGLTIYFSETEGEAIVDMLGARLPLQEIQLDSLEKLIRWIKL